MTSRTAAIVALAGALLAGAGSCAAQAERMVRVELAYRAPGNGPRPNFSPYGTQVKLSDLPRDAAVPEGAARPARMGVVQIGPGQSSWMRILVTADATHPRDFCRLYLDRNRNGDFTDDGAPLTAIPTMNEKTKAWWSSFNGAELSIAYGSGVVEPYMVNFWAVREGDNTPDLIRYSVASWRSGTVQVDGVEALVAVMDANNDAVFDARDKWSVLVASEPNAGSRVLSHSEAWPADRLMFLPQADGKELVLEFRRMSPDGRALSFAVVDRKITKAEDRAPDDTLAAERVRPRVPALRMDRTRFRERSGASEPIRAKTDRGFLDLVVRTLPRVRRMGLDRCRSGQPIECRIHQSQAGWRPG